MKRQDKHLKRKKNKKVLRITEKTPSNTNIRDKEGKLFALQRERERERGGLGWRIPSLSVQISNFFIHQPNEPSGNMALHSSVNVYKAERETLSKKVQKRGSIIKTQKKAV